MKILRESNIEEIVTALRAGAVLILPTDTVYGLVCDALNKKSVEQIFKIKNRNKTKPLAVFVKDIDMAKEYVEIDEKQEIEMQKNWPGAVTFILKLRPKSLKSKLLTKNGTIGLRQPDYELISRIFEEFENPLAQTSANVSGRTPALEIKEVLEEFMGEDITVVDAGDLPENKPSTIIDLTNEKKIIRN